MLKQQIHEELVAAMKAHDEVKKSTLRMLFSAIQYCEMSKGKAGYEATDEDVLGVIQKEVKQRKDSIEQFEKGGRKDLVDKEKAELTLLETYLPKQMDENEVRDLVKEAISQSGTTSVSEMGKIMGVLMPKVKGKADGGLVSKIVKEELQAK